AEKCARTAGRGRRSVSTMARQPDRRAGRAPALADPVDGNAQTPLLNGRPFPSLDYRVERRETAPSTRRVHPLEGDGAAGECPRFDPGYGAHVARRDLVGGTERQRTAAARTGVRRIV